ncbi:hypothetical protein ACFL5O_10930 [Myxococcota bacterium]
MNWSAACCLLVVTIQLTLGCSSDQGSGLTSTATEPVVCPQLGTVLPQDYAQCFAFGGQQGSSPSVGRICVISFGEVDAPAHFQECLSVGGIVSSSVTRFCRITYPEFTCACVPNSC